MDPPESDRNRQQRAYGAQASGDDRDASPPLGDSQEPDHPQGEQHGEKQQVITRAEAGHDERRHKQHERSRPAGRHEIMQSDERGRHRKRGEKLEMFDVRDPVRIEPVHQSGDGGSVVPFRQCETEPVRRQRAERERQQQRQVVCGHRSEAEPLQGRRDQALAETVIRERERAARWKKSKAVPPPGSQREDVRIPPQDRRRHERVAEIMWNNRREMEDERKGQRHGQRRVENECYGRGAPRHAQS